MTRREAKKYVCTVAGEILLAETYIGAEWLWMNEDSEEISEPDKARIIAAVKELADELIRRGAS